MTLEIWIQLTGFFAIRRDGTRQFLPVKGPTKKLLIFLCFQANHFHSRDYVIEQVWPEKDLERGRSVMSTALWRLRNVLSSFPGLNITCSDDLVKLHVDQDINIDVFELQRLLKNAVECKQTNEVIDENSAIQLRKLLTKVYPVLLNGSNEAWILAEREKHAIAYIQALSLLMKRAVLDGQIRDAILYCLEILNIDFFQEGYQRELIWLYVIDGQRTKAINQYNELKIRLRNEFGVEPMLETQLNFDYVMAEHENRLLSDLKNTCESHELISQIEQIRKEQFRVLIGASSAQ